MVPSTAVLKSRRQTNPPPTPSLGEEASTHRPNGADAVTPAAFKAATGRVPGLAVVLVGDDPASAVYVGSKGKATLAAGMESFEHRLPATATQDEVEAAVRGGSSLVVLTDERASETRLSVPMILATAGAGLRTGFRRRNRTGWTRRLGWIRRRLARARRSHRHSRHHSPRARSRRRACSQKTTVLA